MAERRDAPLFERIGGEQGCWRLARAFYGHVAHDPLLRPFFSKSGNFRCAIEALSTFTIQALGGPARFSEMRARPGIRAFHEQFRITPEIANAWVSDMAASLDDLGIADEDRAALLEFYSRTASLLTDHPRAGDALPQGASASSEAETLWHTYRATEALVESIAAHDSAAAISTLEADPLEGRTANGGALLLSILAAMGTSGDEAMFAYARARLERQPDIVNGRYAGGNTMLHDAAGSWCCPFVDFLLRLGADPNVGERSPLYGAANAYRKEPDSAAGGVKVVQSLIAAGADVNLRIGVKRCTALHMAARRGHAGIAEELLDAGAEVDPRDSIGDTPLRRAVNCGFPKVAALLLLRGADPDCVGSRGLTPARAARSDAMRAVFCAPRG